MIFPITFKSLLLKAFFVLSLLFVNQHLYPQKSEEKKLLRSARRSLDNENYKLAQEKYLKLVNISPKNDVYNFEAGLSYYFSKVKRYKSIPFFEAALDNSKKDTIPELNYYLARAYQLNADYEKAKARFNDFIAVIKIKSRAGQFLLRQTHQLIKKTETSKKYAEEQKQKMEKQNFVDRSDTSITYEVIYEVKNLGKEVNTEHSEYAPVFRKNDNVLLFTSRRKGTKKIKLATDLLPYEDIYVAKKINNQFTLLTNNDAIEKILPNGSNTKKHDVGITYSLDGNMLYSYRKGDIWVSVFKNNKWSSYKRLAKEITKSKYNNSSISISPDGNTLFFVARTRSGIGRKDIFQSTKGSDGKWSAPKNLGEGVNTKYDENAPFLLNNGKTLFFSSKNQKGMGGYDVYKSVLVNGKWTAAKNMGTPINSTDDDIYFICDDTEENGFLSSDRKGGHGDMDLYSFNVWCGNIKTTEIKGTIYAKNSQQPINAELTMINAGNSDLSYTSSPSDGKFSLSLPPDNKYTLTISAKGYENQTITITLPKQCEDYPLLMEIALEKVSLDGKNYQIATLQNSFSNTNSKSDTTITDSLEVITDNLITAKDSLLNKLVSTPDFKLQLYFDYKKSTLRESALDKLDKIFMYLSRDEHKKVRLRITGHSDTMGTEEDNMAISKERANVVANYLIKKGMAKSRIEIDYKGGKEPLAPNQNPDGSDNPENRQRNRRVAFSLIR